MFILRFVETDAVDVDDASDTVISAKGYGWTARLIADVPFHFAVAGTAEATDESPYVNEFEPLYISVSAQEELALLGTDIGTVWVSEIKVSS
jgi:hypothetical protein